jgi:predicted ATPase/DNA-binding winged helix-turn-helix (wHTH) protein
MSLLADSSAISAGAAPVAEMLEAGETVLAFGHYLLFPRRRQLLAESKPVELGSRAFDTLLVLVEAEGRLVTKDQLLKRVWPNTTVEEKNISVQIAALRKALGSKRELVKTDSGRGYRFASTVRRIVSEPDMPAPPGSSAGRIERPSAPPTNLPVPLLPLIGRERELDELPDLVLDHRLVTLTGAGGIGKTQLGLELARRLRPLFSGGSWVVDLGPLVNPDLVAGTIACTLGIEAGFERMPTEFGIVGDRKSMLIMLDSCEHVIEAAARATEVLLRAVPGLHLIATSREPLAAEGEHIYRVAPLKVPPTNISRAARVMEHSAVQLFVERARAADPGIRLDDRDVLIAAKVCRGLDGIPLAIELAAASMATIGLDALAARLDDSFDLLAGGRRTAMPRHQTLRATLDWSYRLLDDDSQAVFRRLAVFAGGFTLESATEVVSLDPVGELQARRLISDLVSKSLVTFDVRGTVSRYRLLDTTRAYAREKLSESGELDAIAGRHAVHYRKMLEKAAPGWQTTPAPELVAAYAPEIDNIRAALHFAFASDRDRQLGTALTAASVPLWMLLSILGECRDLVTRALSCLGEGSPDQDRQEMLLQSALATSSIWSKGPVTAACAAAERTLELAARLDDTEYQLRALYVQWIYRLRIGEYQISRAVAGRMRRIAEAAADLPGALTGARLEGVSLHYLGDQRRARDIMEHVAKHTGSNIHRAFVVRFGLDQRCAALMYLARILWLQGFPE